MIMPVSRNTIAGVLLLAAVVGGCRCPSGGCLPATPTAPCNPDPTYADAEPPELVRLTPDGYRGTSIAPLPAPGETYETFTVAQCQCQAATNCNTANLVELERHWAQVIIECDSKYVARNQCLFRDLLALHATDLRNDAAGDALVAYYRLAGLEAQNYYLERAIEETRLSLDRADEITESGLPVDIDRSDIAANLYDLEDRQLQLQLKRLQLNGQIKKLVGCTLDDDSFLWPRIDWTPDLAPVDVDAEVAEGISTRYDLRGLQLLHCNLEKRTLRVARGVLKAADSTLGAVEPTEGWVHRVRCWNCYDSELPVRCRQLAMLFTDTEELAIGEIKSTAYEVTMQQNRVALARQAVVERREQLYRVTAKRDVDDTTAFEITQLRAKLYEAEGQLIAQIVGLRSAQTRLKQAKGLLALECGFCPTLCTEGCCNGPCTQCQPPTCCPRTCECKKCQRVMSSH
ncbi:MAG: TolC family protein [Planctomycetales bacterium]|nr:TolC family protein [Planctomycetales bacterium]